MTIRNDSAKHRFELEIDGHTVFADYRQDDNILLIHHVEAPPALRGTGAAGKLMQGIVEHAHTKNLKLRPICGYAAAWLKKHKESHDLLA